MQVLPVAVVGHHRRLVLSVPELAAAEPGSSTALTQRGWESHKGV